MSGWGTKQGSVLEMLVFGALKMMVWETEVSQSARQKRRRMLVAVGERNVKRAQKSQDTEQESLI